MSDLSPDLLGDGTALPRMECRPPGPNSRSLAAELQKREAPRVNTWVGPTAPIVWRAARGSNVVDVDGNRYVDLTAGFGAASIGHRHPHVVAAVERQAAELVHGLADVAAHPARIDLARRLCELAPISDARVYFAISGSDAVEIALETAWLHTGRSDVLAFEPAYHGTTLGSLSLASRHEFRAPFREHLLRGVTRLAHGASPDEIDTLLGRGSFAAAVVEPIVGREGVLLPASGWLATLGEICRRHGVLLIADEIFTGFGRTGSLFVCEAEGVVPDLLCCGKALGGGLPVAAVIGPSTILAAWDRPGEALHTATFLAHPLACAAAVAALEVLETEDLPERARRLGRGVAERLALWSDLETVDAVAGRGLLWTVELVSADEAGRLARQALERGLLTLSSGKRLQLVPPLVVTERQLDHTLDTLGELLGADRPQA